jgi:predicted amidohydrolase YtcJ
MRGEPEILAFLQHHFTAYREAIGRLWHDRDDFRELGEAYQECTVAYQYWAKEEGASSVTAREYESLLENLRDDIVHYMESTPESFVRCDPHR